MTATLRASKNRCDRGGLGPVLAGLHHADRGVGGVDRELQPHHAVLVAAGDLVAGVAEDLDHPAVLRQHLGDEPVDAALAAGLGEVLEQQLARSRGPGGRPGPGRRPRPRRARRPASLGRDPVEAADRDHLARATVSTNATRSWWSTWVNRCDVALGQRAASARRTGGTSTRPRPARRTRPAASSSSGADRPQVRRRGRPGAGRRPPSAAGTAAVARSAPSSVALTRRNLPFRGPQRRAPA